MIEVKLGDRIEAVCRFDYEGPAGNFTFAQEIGTWFAVIGTFTDLDRWEEVFYITPGAGQSKRMVFTILAADGLRPGVVYDMNFEIGTGSKGNGTWHLLKREITDDIIRIAEAIQDFANLSVSYKKV